jgi:hypothetical protein
MKDVELATYYISILEEKSPWRAYAIANETWRIGFAVKASEPTADYAVT